MPWLIAIFIIVALFFVGAGVRQGFGPSRAMAQVTAKKVSKASRAELEAMLKNIETKPAPAEKMGAMCYKVVGPPEYIEYTCPIDGQKSVYGRTTQEELDVYAQAAAVDEKRRQVELLNSLTSLVHFKLDEKRLCHTCCPGLKTDHHRHVLLVTEYPDGRTHSHKLVKPDLQLLIGFFKKELSWDAGQDRTAPLKGNEERIRKILGIEGR